MLSTLVSKPFVRAFTAGVSILLVLSLVACGGQESSAAQRRADTRDAGGAAGAGSGQTVGVVTEAARAEDIQYEVEALGTAHANEAVEITSKVSNLVTGIRFREGQNVRRGAVLVELDNISATAELAAARAALTEAQGQYKRSQELYSTQALSQAQLDQIVATLRASEARVTSAESRLSDLTIRAPFDGRIGLRRVSVGSFVSPGALITTLDDTRVIKLDFAVPETYLAILRDGLPLAASSVAFPGRSFEGQIVSIDSRLDPQTRSVTARAALPNPDGVLKPGMFLTVKLRQDSQRVVTIPEQALVPEEGRQFVFVVASGRAEKREVTIGRRQPGRVEVVVGLKSGETVVVEGTQKVRDGGPVRELAGGDAPPAAAS